MLPRRKSYGVTLLELLIVIALISILATLFVNNQIGQLRKGRDVRRKHDLTQLKPALYDYYKDCRLFPDHEVVSGISTIAGCDPGGIRSCPWGSAWTTTTSGLCNSGKTYMSRLPMDPTNVSPYVYSYIRMNPVNDNFRLFSRLEYTGDPGIVQSQTRCLGAADGTSNYYVCQD